MIDINLMSHKDLVDFARRDDCLEQMVPSDLRLILAVKSALEAERDALLLRLHMAEEQIRECREYLRLDDRNLVVGHIDAYFSLPALQEDKQDGN